MESNGGPEPTERGLDIGVQSRLLQSALPVVEEKENDQLPSVWHHSLDVGRSRRETSAVQEQRRGRADREQWHW